MSPEANFTNQLCSKYQHETFFDEHENLKCSNCGKLWIAEKYLKQKLVYMP